MPFTRARAAAIIAVSTLALASCGGGDQPAPETESPAVDTTVAETEAHDSAPTNTTPREAEENSAVRSSTAEQASSISNSSTTANAADAKEKETLDEVRERFSVLAPPEFFEKLDGCSQADMEGYYDCAGAEVGQFQFFDSESKAASTTQVLTELRSSKIVEDNGNRVVGWSTVGTSAIVTVVDNSEGQVMQHLISTDREDPRRMIYDLGLAKES